MIDVSVIIVNYNTSDLTLACVNSVVYYTEGLSYEIIVVDNNSQKDDVSKLRNNHLYRLIENNDNLGFGMANNIGVNRSVGKYVFFLNSDTLLLTNIIKELFIFSEQHNEIGAVGCLLMGEYLQDIHSAGRFRTPSSMFRNLLSKMLPSSSYDKKVLANIRGKDYEEVDYVTGADLMMKKSLFEEIGGFDINYFMYNEDSDIQLRIKEKGYKRVIVNSRGILHLCGASIPKQMSYAKYYMGQKSLKYYVKKNFKGVGFYIMYLTIILSNIKNLVLNGNIFSKDEVKSIVCLLFKMNK